MILQRKPSRWSCTPVSFAMVLNIPVEDIFMAIGHDGSDILWPDLPEPMCRRGFHIQEMIQFAMNRGYAVTPVELNPVLECNGKHYIFEERWKTLLNTVENSVGVLTGRGFKTGHTVAYSFGQVFDPDGGVYDYSKIECERKHFYANCAWRVDRRFDV